MPFRFHNFFTSIPPSTPHANIDDKEVEAFLNAPQRVTKSTYNPNLWINLCSETHLIIDSLQASTDTSDLGAHIKGLFSTQALPPKDPTNHLKVKMLLEKVSFHLHKLELQDPRYIFDGHRNKKPSSIAEALDIITSIHTITSDLYIEWRARTYVQGTIYKARSFYPENYSQEDWPAFENHVGILLAFLNDHYDLKNVTPIAEKFTPYKNSETGIIEPIQPAKLHQLILIKKSLERVAFLASLQQNPKTSMGRYRGEEFLCEGGIIGKLKTIIQELSLSQARFTDFLAIAKRMWILQQAQLFVMSYRAPEFLQEYLVNNQIHYAESLLTHYATHFSITPLERHEDDHIIAFEQNSLTPIQFYSFLTGTLHQTEPTNSYITLVVQLILAELPDFEQYKENPSGFRLALMHAIHRFELHVIIDDPTILIHQDSNEIPIGNGLKKHVEEILFQLIYEYLYQQSVITERSRIPIDALKTLEQATDEATETGTITIARYEELKKLSHHDMWSLSPYIDMCRIPLSDDLAATLTRDPIHRPFLGNAFIFGIQTNNQALWEKAFQQLDPEDQGPWAASIILRENSRAGCLHLLANISTMLSINPLIAKRILTGSGDAALTKNNPLFMQFATSSNFDLMRLFFLFIQQHKNLLMNTIDGVNNQNLIPHEIFIRVQFHNPDDTLIILLCEFKSILNNYQLLVLKNIGRDLILQESPSQLVGKLIQHFPKVADYTLNVADFERKSSVIRYMLSHQAIAAALSSPALGLLLSKLYVYDINLTRDLLKNPDFYHRISSVHNGYVLRELFRILAQQNDYQTLYLFLCNQHYLQHIYFEHFWKALFDSIWFQQTEMYDILVQNMCHWENSLEPGRTFTMLCLVADRNITSPLCNHPFRNRMISTVQYLLQRLDYTAYHQLILCILGADPSYTKHLCNIVFSPRFFTSHTTNVWLCYMSQAIHENNISTFDTLIETPIRWEVSYPQIKEWISVAIVNNYPHIFNTLMRKMPHNAVTLGNILHTILENRNQSLLDSFFENHVPHHSNALESSFFDNSLQQCVSASFLPSPKLLRKLCTRTNAHKLDSAIRSSTDRPDLCLSVLNEAGMHRVSSLLLLDVTQTMCKNHPNHSYTQLLDEIKRRVVAGGYGFRLSEDKSSLCYHTRSCSSLHPLDTLYKGNEAKREELLKATEKPEVTSSTLHKPTAKQFHCRKKATIRKQ